MDAGTGLGLLIAVASALTLNWAYVQEHGAASGLPELSLRHPLRTVRLLLRSGPWLRGLAAEVTGFSLYVLALALAPLSLVQAVSAGGIAALAYLAARRQGRSPTRRERVGVGVSLVGLAALGISLAGSTGEHGDVTVTTVSLWLGVSGLVALVAIAVSGRLGRGVPYAMAAGILLASGDISMKAAFEGGGHLVFLATGGVGYVLGTILLQIAYQHTVALTAAGISTLLINTLPILAATTILGEDIPSGPLGVLRVLAFVTVVVGAVALARGEPEAPHASPHAGPLAVGEATSHG